MEEYFMSEIKPLYEMDGKLVRPATTQKVIDEFTKILDSQDLKGVEKYGVTIDAADDNKYNWLIMSLEETADLQKYLVKEIKRLEKVVHELTEELEKRGHAISENCDLRVEIEDLKITNEKLTNRANSWERIANGNYKAVVKVEKERDEFKKQFVKAHAEIQDLQYQKKILAEQLTLATSGEKKNHDCHKNQAIHWQGKDIVKVKCLICDKTLYQA
jgi:uncharacterized coiled-coil DUF342 family protein